jgi:hypothetical protein
MDAPTFSLITAVKPGRLSKSFKLDNKGRLQKIPGGQLMKGELRRVCPADAKALAILMQEVTPSQALIYGVTVHEAARVVTQSEVKKVKQNVGLPVIARTREYFEWPQGPSILMLDYDSPDGSEPLTAEGFRSEVYEICPALQKAPHVVAASASSFIYKKQVLLRGASGWRILVIVADGRDIPRAGAAFFSRCWLKGRGYIALSKAGSLLERSLVDPNVWQPERLDFC